MKRGVGDKRRIGPGLATADCRRARARDPRFDAWLRHAANDPDAACSLVEAYVCLAPVERRAFRAALRNDALRNASHARTVALVGSLDADPTWEAWENEGRVTIVASGAGGLTLDRGRIRWSRRSEPEGARIPVPDAVDRVTRALWAARRAGRRWPPALSAFADLFDVASSHAG